MVHVTFDTNVYTHLAAPDKCPGHPFHNEIHLLINAIENKKITAYISEGSLSLEALSRHDRIDIFFRAWAEKYPGPIVLPAASPEASEEFKHMIEMGCKILNNPRIALGSFVDVPGTAWSDDLRHPIEERQKRQSEFIRSHENPNSGFPLLETLGTELANLHGLKNPWWIKGIVSEFDNQKKFTSVKQYVNKVRNITADWFDIDIVASHYAYGLDFFCTCDNGENSGRSSILHKSNRRELEEKWQVKVVNPKEILGQF